MQARDYAKSTTYIAFAWLALMAGYVVLMVGHALCQSLRLLDDTLREVNRPCAALVDGRMQPCGTLADVAKTLNTFRNTAGQVEIAARHENAQLATLDRQEAQIYTDIHAELLTTQQLTASLTETSRAASTTLADASRAIQTANETIASAQPALEGAGRVTLHADQLLTGPQLQKFLDSATDTSAQADATASDVRRVSDNLTQRFLHPPPRHWWNYAGRVWSVAWQAAMLWK